MQMIDEEMGQTYIFQSQKSKKHLNEIEKLNLNTFISNIRMKHTKKALFTLKM